MSNRTNPVMALIKPLPCLYLTTLPSSKNPISEDHQAVCKKEHVCACAKTPLGDKFLQNQSEKASLSK